MGSCFRKRRCEGHTEIRLASGNSLRQANSRLHKAPLTEGNHHPPESFLTCREGPGLSLFRRTARDSRCFCQTRQPEQSEARPGLPRKSSSSMHKRFRKRKGFSHFVEGQSVEEKKTQRSHHFLISHRVITNPGEV